MKEHLICLKKKTKMLKDILGENISDFSESFLKCCSDYALNLAQICVLKIANFKNLSNAFMTKLAMGNYIKCKLKTNEI